MSAKIPFIDYSQYAAFHECSWKWYEKAVNQRQRRFTAVQRDDALAIGSLVHAGLETWYRDGRPEIPQTTIAEISPTTVALGYAQGLVNGYVQRFPEEKWELLRTEQPIRFPLISGEDGSPAWDGLAKLDLYFYTNTDLTIETGLANEPTVLSAGLWVQEYKTKSSQIPWDIYLRSWQSNMQASFQMLALGAIAGEVPVQGVLVNVINKPQLYVPKRTCKGCGEQAPFTSYLAIPEGYQCVVCLKVNQFEPYTPKRASVADYYRMVVTRSPVDLDRATEEIRATARAMQSMIDYGPHVQPASRTKCVDLFSKRTCEFFEPHTYNFDTRDAVEFVQVEDYVKEKAWTEIT